MKKIITSLLIGFFAAVSFAKTPLTIVVGFPPGGDTDVLARLVATKLTTVLDRPVVVENRIGASGAIASNYVSSAPADGSVIMLAPSTFVTAPLVNSNIKYSAVNDFTPIMQLSGHGMVAVINSNTGVTNIKELIAANKDNRVKNFGSPGVGTPMHILGEMFNRAAKTDIAHIPFKGNSEVVNNMLGNQISFTWITLLPVIPQVEAGKMTVIGIASSKRSPFYPNVPTLAEQGIKDVEVDSWLGFLGPKELSKEIANDLNAKLNQVIQLPEVREKLKGLAMQPVGAGPEVFKDTINKDTIKYTRVIKTLGIKIE
jgi:tripartite-type tricarboxylate transporter receptor subunit TctC